MAFDKYILEKMITISGKNAAFDLSCFIYLSKIEEIIADNHVPPIDWAVSLAKETPSIHLRKKS